MHIVRLSAALLALAWSAESFAQAPSPTPLRVIRAAPTGDANPLAQIAVTFDRPVAGSLDRVSRSGHRASRRAGDRRQARMARPGDGAPRSVDAARARTHVHGHGIQRLPFHGRRRARRAVPVHLPRARTHALAGTPARARRWSSRTAHAEPDTSSSYTALQSISRSSRRRLTSSSARPAPVNGSFGARAVSQHPVADAGRNDEEEGDEGPPRNAALDSLRRAVVNWFRNQPLPYGCSGELRGAQGG